MVKVPECEACTTKECCVTLCVDLTPEEMEAGVYETSTHNPRYIKSQLGGRCWYLNEQDQCSIYHSRPECCKTFSCLTKHYSDHTPEEKEDNRIWKSEHIST